MIARFAMFGLTYCWLLGPRFIFADLMWLTVFGLALASPLVGAHRSVTKWPMNFFWLMAAALAFYSLGVAIAYGTMDAGYALSWFKAGVYACSAATLVVLYRRSHSELALERLMRDIVLATTISAVIAITMYVIPAVRELISGLIVGTIANSWNGQKGIRAYDLSIGGGTAYGFFNLIVMLMLYHRKTIFNPNSRIAIFILLSTVNFLTARSAFIVTIGLFFVGLIFNLAPSRLFPTALRSSSILFIIGGGAFLILGLVSGLPSVDDGGIISNFSQNTLPWALELFISLEKGDGPSSTTTTYMLEELFFPESILGLLFGMGDSAPSSDSGLVRTIFAVGILGLVVHLVLVAGFWYTALSHISGKAERLIFSGTATLLLLVNFKELTFSNSRGLFGILALFFFSFIILRAPRASRQLAYSHRSHQGRKGKEAAYLKEQIQRENALKFF